MNKEKWLAIVLTIGSCPSGILRAIGFFVLAPLLYNACEYLFNTGNTDGLKYVDTYIKDSKIISINFPHSYDQTWFKFNSYSDRYRHKKCCYTRSFYSDSLKRYISFYMFEGVDFFNKEKRGGDLGAGRIKSYFNPDNVFLVHINKTQLNDPKYGTKENPVPVFWHKFVSGTVDRQIKMDNTPYDRSTKSIPYFDVQDNVTAEENRLFVTEYLTRIIDKDELVRLFGKK